MAISLVGTAFNTAANGGSCTVTLPGGLAQNDIVLVCGGHGNDTGSSNASISTSGYTQLDQQSVAGTVNGVIAWKRMGASPDATVTGTGGGDTSNGVAYVAMVFRGVSTTTAIDATTIGLTGHSSQPNSDPITTATNAAAVITAFVVETTRTVNTTPTGYIDTVQAASGDTKEASAAAAWRTVSPVGSENPAPWILDSGISRDWVAFTVALRPSTAVFDDASISATGTGTVALIGAPLADGALAVTGTATVGMTGVADTANSGQLEVYPVATVAFTGEAVTTSDAVFASQGMATLSMIGKRFGLIKSISKTTVGRGQKRSEVSINRDVL